MVQEFPGREVQGVKIFDQNKKGHNQNHEDGEEPELRVLLLQALDISEGLRFLDIFIELPFEDLVFLDWPRGFFSRHSFPHDGLGAICTAGGVLQS